MGQQQLLLIIAGVIIVALAVTVALSIVNSNAEEKAKDELVSQVSIIGANAQQWYRRPVGLKGGGGAFNTSKGADSSYQIPHLLNHTENAIYIIESILDTVLIINAIPDSTYGYNWRIKTTVNQKLVTSEVINE